MLCEQWIKGPLQAQKIPESWPLTCISLVDFPIFRYTYIYIYVCICTMKNFVDYDSETFSILKIGKVKVC